MIYVTLGTQNFQFDRLLIKLDQLIEDGHIKRDNIIVQCKYAEYAPKHFTAFKLASQDEVENYLKQADIVLTHAGTGSIVSCIRHKKKTIILPRLVEFGEHIDNHQLEIAEVFKVKAGADVITSMDELDAYLIDGKEPKVISFELNNDKMLKSIETFIQEC